MDENLVLNRPTAESKTRVKNSSKNLKQKTLSAELLNVFTSEEIKAEVQCWKRLTDCLKGYSISSAKNNSFNRICGKNVTVIIQTEKRNLRTQNSKQLNNLRIGLCLANPKEQKLLIKFRKIGLRRLNVFLTNSTRKEIQSKDVKLLTWCCLSLLSFYYSKRQEDECTCFKNNKMDRSKAVFRTAMYLVLPEKQYEVIKFTIRYITLTFQWNSDEYDSFVFQELITIITKPELLLAKIIKQIETSQREDAIREAFNISCTLSSILEHAYWDKYLFNHLLHNCLNTLLKVYLLCNVPMSSNLKIDNAKFRMVIKTCIKYFISNIKDNKGLVSVLDSMAKCLHDTTILEEDRVEIMEMIAFCSQKHHTKLLRESITPDLLDLLLNSLLSNNKVLALTSHKILHHLLDRRGNEINFTEPVYYFKGRSSFSTNYDFSSEDAQYFKSFSEKFLKGIHHCFLTFNEKYALVTCYVTLCLVLVEVPEPVITINIIRVLITTQNTVLLSEDLTLTVKAQIHGIISALISLICVIHDEEVHPLKRYVEEVVRFRTENSPHLLPPLQNKYTVASHHTTEYHEQLYFTEEEVLYALQRCWLSKRIQGSK